LKDIEDETVSLDCGDTLRSVKCICGQRPTQFRRQSTTTTMTTTTMMTSEHKDYGQSRRQSTDQVPTILCHSATKKKYYWRCRHSWRLWMKIKWRDATHTGSYRLRSNQHLYDTEAFQGTRNITSGGTHHHPHHDRRCDATCKGQPEDADHSPVLGLSPTGRQIRRASRANAGVRFSTWLTMVSQTQS
jgi:hypothetical protein